MTKERTNQETSLRFIGRTKWGGGELKQTFSDNDVGRYRMIFCGYNSGGGWDDQTNRGKEYAKVPQERERTIFGQGKTTHFKSMG